MNENRTLNYVPSAWHLPTRFLLARGGEGTVGDFASVVVGLVFGLLWDRYRDLPLLVAMHARIDTLPGLWSFLGVTH